MLGPLGLDYCSGLLRGPTLARTWKHYCHLIMGYCKSVLTDASVSIKGTSLSWASLITWSLVSKARNSVSSWPQWNITGSWECFS